MKNKLADWGCVSKWEKGFPFGEWHKNPLKDSSNPEEVRKQNVVQIRAMGTIGYTLPNKIKAAV